MSDSAADSTSAADALFARVLADRDVRIVFQPMVDLQSGQVIGLEALARGPESSILASPKELFDAARRADRVAELDWVCRANAFQAFLDEGVPPSISLFVNVEAEAIGAPCPADLAPVIRRAESHLRVFVEVSARAMAADPAGVLTAADRARDMGWGIAIDNVGGSPSPIAMLAIVGPDVVKLDLRQLREAGRVATAEIIPSVLRHTEKTGAVLLVEGIETEEDEHWALALGAAYGQGHFLGMPAPLEEEYVAPIAPIPMIKVAPPDLHVGSPFELFDGGPMVVKTNETHLNDLWTIFARRPFGRSSPSVYLMCVGDEELPEPLLSSAIPRTSLVFVAFGVEMLPKPFEGVRGVRLPRGDPFAGEKFLIVLSDQAPVAIFSKSFSPEYHDTAITQDVELVHEIARHIIRRVPPLGQDNTALGGATQVVNPAESEQEEPEAKRGWRGWRS